MNTMKFVLMAVMAFAVLGDARATPKIQVNGYSTGKVHAALAAKARVAISRSGSHANIKPIIEAMRAVESSGAATQAQPRKRNLRKIVPAKAVVVDQE